MVGVLGARHAAHLGAPPIDHESIEYASIDKEARTQKLDTQYARWIDGGAQPTRLTATQAFLREAGTGFRGQIS